MMAMNNPIGRFYKSMCGIKKLFGPFSSLCLLFLLSLMPNIDVLASRDMPDNGDILTKLQEHTSGLEPGFPAQVWCDAGAYLSGPVINALVGNIDSDPQLEILGSGLAAGPLYAWKSNGSLVPGWPIYYYDRVFYSTLGDLNNSIPGLEILTGQFMYRAGTIPPGPVLALTGSGLLLPGWPIESADDISHPAALVDIDNDGIDEIFIYDANSSIQGFKSDGSSLPGWPVPGHSSPATADLDGDGDIEIVTFTNWTSTGADLVAYHHDGSRVDGFAFHYPDGPVPFPVIGDVDGDEHPEIMIIVDEKEANYYVYVISWDGQLERKLYATVKNQWMIFPFSSAFALADLDGDLVPEIIVAYSGAINIFRGDGTPFPGFPIIWAESSWLIGNSAPVVGDVDGEKDQDIVFTYEPDLYNTVVIVYDQYGNLQPGFPKNLPLGAGAVPAIADIDIDGRNEIIVMGAKWDGYPGMKDFVWVYDLGGSEHGSVQWGQFMGGPKHQGTYPFYWRNQVFFPIINSGSTSQLH